MKPYAREVYERLLAGGEAELRAQLRRPDPEDTYIDFKQVASPSALYTAPSGPSLHQDDKKNLGNSLSGFANTLGGVIVWGARCTGNKPHLRKLTPGVPHVDQFKGYLRSIISGATVPGLPDVDLEVVPLPSLPGKRGAVLMYVPRREYGPVMSNLGVDAGRYFYRSQDGFHRVTHDMLASMFGKTPPPDVFWKVIVASNRSARQNGTVEVEAAILLHNKGPALAFHPYVTFSAITPGDNCSLKYMEADANRFDMHGVLGHFVTIVGKPQHPLPAGGMAGAVVVTLTLRPPFTRALRLSVGSGADKSLPHETERGVAASEVQAAYDRAMQGGASQADVWGELFPNPTV